MLIFLAALTPAVYADLSLDTTIKPGEVFAKLEPQLETTVKAYGDSHSADFGGSIGKYGTYPYFEGSNFSWRLNSEKYFSEIAAFVPDSTPVEDCRSNRDNPLNNYCDQARIRHLVCHLFMFSHNLLLEGVTPLNIKRDSRVLLGKPLCRSVKAMSVAKEIPNGMLVTLGYSDSGAPTDPRNDPPEFVTTVLLRFDDEGGKLKVEQDDSCLGNPNKYATIAHARKALKQCSGKK
ncbi:MAG TPA: hypothetical protein VK165_06595 [Azonexus sp.]|nr:hypothetical protein [Azonexus sp.]